MPTTPDISIRPELSSDIEVIYAINDAAFGQPAEAKLVDRLRDASALTLSLVAVIDGVVVGHIAFSPARIETGNGDLDAIGLAPMAVSPVMQRSGIGAKLVREGLRRLEADGHKFVIVLGHPEYYPRFGFVVGQKHGVECEFPSRPEAFMIRALGAATLDSVKGMARYHGEFQAL